MPNATITNLTGTPWVVTGLNIVLQPAESRVVYLEDADGFLGDARVTDDIVAGRISVVVSGSDPGGAAIPTSQLGVAGGVATLDAVGAVTPAQRGPQSFLFFSATPTDGTYKIFGTQDYFANVPLTSGGGAVAIAEPLYGGKLSGYVDTSGTHPLTLRVTGTEVSPITGAETPAATEDIPITFSDGYFMGTKSWLTAVTLEIVEPVGKTASVDPSRTQLCLNQERDFRVTGMCMDWEPSASPWNINPRLIEIDAVGEEFTRFNVQKNNSGSPPWAAVGDKGLYSRRDLDIPILASTGAGLIATLAVTGLKNVTVQFFYEEL